MAKYIKKPIPIEAYQTDKEMVIHTLEGDMLARAGDYIIIGIQGEQYPCKKEIFEASYTKVEEKSTLRKKEKSTEDKNICRWCKYRSPLGKADVYYCYKDGAIGKRVKGSEHRECYIYQFS